MNIITRKGKQKKLLRSKSVPILMFLKSRGVLRPVNRGN